MNLNGKVVWITGASSGIGQALAIEYAKKGAQLILSSRSIEKLEAISTSLKEMGAKVKVAPLDLEDTHSIRLAAKNVLTDFPKIDVLINNGGISQRALSMETDLAVERKIMETNFFGAITLTKEILPALVKDGGGQIIVISSVVGKFGFPLRTAYSASKHALQGYFEALRAEVYDKNVKVLIVSPGRIYTNISLNAMDKEGKKHGKMDEGQANGMPANICAQKIVRAAINNKKELLVGGKEVIMVYIRKFAPALFHRLAKNIKAT